MHATIFTLFGKFTKADLTDSEKSELANFVVKKNKNPMQIWARWEPQKKKTVEEGINQLLWKRSTQYLGIISEKRHHI